MEYLLNAQAVASTSSFSQASVSADEAQLALQGNKTGAASFHTAVEFDPWWLCDLRILSAITKICVYNCASADTGMEQFSVSLSDDCKHWREVYNSTESFGDYASGRFLTLDFPTPEIARFIRCVSHGFCSLQLDKVDIYSDDDYIVSQGFLCKKHPQVISPTVLRCLKAQVYEEAERCICMTTVAPGERIVELGAGLGFMSTLICKHFDVASYVCLEANPHLVPVIRQHHFLNRVHSCKVINAVATSQPITQKTCNFYIHKDFWASSLTPGEHVDVAEVPVLDFHELLQREAPTYLICDIEGGEWDLFDGVDLRSVKKICLELHGGTDAERADFFARFARQSLHLVAERGENCYYLQRR